MEAGGVGLGVGLEGEALEVYFLNQEKGKSF